jgi:hypothetical protein
VRIIIKPAGLAAIIAAFIAVLGIMAFSSRKEKNATAATPTAAKPLPASAGTRIVPVSYLFSARNGTSVSDTDHTAVKGELVNGAEYRKTPKGFSVALNGAQKQYVDMGKPLVDTTRSFSLSAWVRLNDTNGFHTFVSQDGTAISGFYFQKRQDTGRLSFTLNSNDAVPPTNPGEAEPIKGYRAESSFPAKAGEWYHLVGLYDARNHRTRLYVNGKLEQTKALPASVAFWPAKGHTMIGAALWEGKRVDYTNGMVENVRIYPRVLTADDVTYLYKNRL